MSNLISKEMCSLHGNKKKKYLAHLVALWKCTLKPSLHLSIFKQDLSGRLSWLSTECWIATELTLTADTTVGGWWRCGGVREEEVTNCPSGTKWIIQLYSTKTPTGAKRQQSLYNAWCHQQLNKRRHLLEHEWWTVSLHEHHLPPLSLWLLISSAPCLRLDTIHHLPLRLRLCRLLCGLRTPDAFLWKIFSSLTLTLCAFVPLTFNL